MRSFKRNVDITARKPRQLCFCTYTVILPDGSDCPCVQTDGVVRILPADGRTYRKAGWHWKSSDLKTQPATLKNPACRLFGCFEMRFKRSRNIGAKRLGLFRLILFDLLRSRSRRGIVLSSQFRAEQKYAHKQCKMFSHQKEFRNGRRIWSIVPTLHEACRSSDHAGMLHFCLEPGTRSEAHGWKIWTPFAMGIFTNEWQGRSASAPRMEQLWFRDTSFQAKTRRMSFWTSLRSRCARSTCLIFSSSCLSRTVFSSPFRMMSLKSSLSQGFSMYW